MTEIWAHRGASAYAPENTIRAFQLAEEMGADGVELDVHLTADGEVVVIHDDTLDRTTDREGVVAELTLAEIQRAVMVEQQVVPTLDEVLTLLRPGRMTVNIELKSQDVCAPALVPTAVDVIAASGLGERVIVSSFDHWCLTSVQKLAPTIRLGLLMTDGIHRPWDYAATFGATAIHPNHTWLAVPGYVENAHVAGVAVHTWTANSHADLRMAIASGADAVITNHPDRGLVVRDRC